MSLTRTLSDDIVDLSRLPSGQVMDMVQAGYAFTKAHRYLQDHGKSVVGELVGRGRLALFTHYPHGDVYDFETHAQYYFHRHRPGETGHFHTFLRPRGMPLGVHPVDPADWRGPDDNDALSHLVAIAVDGQGAPVQLFTTNRWVTAETWYRAEDVKRMLPCFQIGHARPSGEVNRWVTGLLGLFRPQIEALLDARDACIAENSHRMPGIPVLEDRDLEMPSVMAIDVEAQMNRLRRVLA